MLGDIFKLFFENKKAAIGFFILLFFVGIAILAPVLAPYDPKANRIETVEILDTDRGRRKTVERETINEFEETRVYTQEETTTYKQYTKKFPLNSPPSSEHYFGTTHSGHENIVDSGYWNRALYDLYCTDTCLSCRIFWWIGG
jgi:peptide/nickel transport system permease protein